MPDKPFKKTTPDEFEAAHDLAISILLRRQGPRFPTFTQLAAEGADVRTLDHAFGLLMGMLAAAIDDECARNRIPYQKAVAEIDRSGSDQIERMRQTESN